MGAMPEEHVTTTVVAPHAPPAVDASPASCSKSWYNVKSWKKFGLGSQHKDDELPSHDASIEVKVKKEVVPPAAFLELFQAADRNDKLLMVIGTIGALGHGVLFPLFAILFGDFTNAFGDPASIDFMAVVSNLALKFTYIAIAALVSGFMKTYCFTLSGNRQANKLRLSFLASVVNQEIAFFDVDATTGGLIQNLNEDSLAVQKAISENLGNFLHHMSTFTTGYIIAFTIGWDMTLVMVACLPLLAAIGFMLARIVTMMTSESASSYANASSIAQQSITQIRTVVAYNQEDKITDKYSEALEEPRRSGIKQSNFVGLSLGGVQIVMLSSYSISLYYGATRIIDGSYDGGQVLSVQIATLLGGFSLGQAVPLISVFAAGRGAGGRMFNVINRKPQIADVDPSGGNPLLDGGKPSPIGNTTSDGGHKQAKPTADGQACINLSTMDKNTVVLMVAGPVGELVESGKEVVLSSIAGDVELRNVRFSYPARLDVPIFTNFCLTVPAGRTVALVGSSGSGKSTVVQLLERFYDPSEGAVLMGGVDIRTVPLTWLRQQIGLVSQEPTLFATTIFENIAIGKEGASAGEIEAAAISANAHKFIMGLPDKYQTQVGERGSQLSGGQKQRIAIARAILKNPKVMLLDEATSALDTTSERIVQQALDQMIVGRTTVVVAHRLSTIQNADSIAVVQAGAVVEQGSHNELVKLPNGVYRLLVQMQLARQEAEAEQTGSGLELEEDDMDSEKIEQEITSKVARESQDQLASGGARLHVRKSSDVFNMFKKEAVSSAKSPMHGVKGPMSPFPRYSGELATRVIQTSGPDGQSFEKASHPTSSGPIASRPTTSGPRSGPVTGDRDSRPVSGEFGRRSATNGKMTTIDIPSSESDVSSKVVVPVAAVGYRRLLEMNRPEWGWGILGAVSSAVAGCQQPAFAFVITSMITLFYTDDMDYLRSKASFYSWMFFVIGFAAFMGLWMQQYAFGVMGQNLAKRVRAALLNSILRQEMGWFDRDENSSGRLTSDLATEATYIRGAVGDVIGLVLQNLATLVVGYVIAFIYDWRMALLITGILPLVILSQVVLMKFNMGNSSDSDEVYKSANQTVTEAFSSIRIIQAYNLQGFICRMYKRMLDEADVVIIRGAWMGGIAFGSSMFIMFAMYGLIIYFGGWEISQGLVSFDGMLKAFLAILLAAMGLAQAGLGFPDVGKAKTAIQRVFPTIDRQPLIDSNSSEGLTPSAADIKGEICFEHVKFVYPSRPEVVIFQDLNLNIAAGKMCALVGESGSGKSTVVGLLERFYDPVAGRVLLDGIDIKDYNLKHLRSLIGLVSQEPLLFSGTVADNIRVGKPGASIEEVEAAAAAANAREFIIKLPEGYNTMVGESGIQLSGGQKQRVAIARAYIKSPKILLLDEATSALDTRSEKVVQVALDALMVGRTSVVIAHRLSTIRDANCICVVYQGLILEQGTHAELMAVPKGHYARMVPTQQATTEP